VESFFAIPDEEIESKLHLQSPWLLCLELDRAKAKMDDRKLTMVYVASRIAETFQADLFVIWSEDNSEKLIIRCRVMGGGDKEDDDARPMEEDVFLRQLENTVLNSVTLRGVQCIKRVFLIKHDKVTITQERIIDARTDKERVLETDDMNLKTVMCVDGVDFKHAYSNELRSVIEFDGTKVNYRHLALLCDVITHRGTLMAITWHSINRTDTGA
jgi:DNA-directed RNA polymerase II subunit RPB1